MTACGSLVNERSVEIHLFKDVKNEISSSSGLCMSVPGGQTAVDGFPAKGATHFTSFQASRSECIRAHFMQYENKTCVRSCQCVVLWSFLALPSKKCPKKSSRRMVKSQNMFGSNWSSWHFSALGFTVLSLRDGTAVGHVVPVMRPQQLATHLPTCTSSLASMVPQHLDVEHDRIGVKATKHVIADTTFDLHPWTSELLRSASVRLSQAHRQSKFGSRQGIWMGKQPESLQKSESAHDRRALFCCENQHLQFASKMEYMFQKYSTCFYIWVHNVPKCPLMIFLKIFSHLRLTVILRLYTYLIPFK